jgi:hypothetical protein
LLISQHASTIQKRGSHAYRVAAYLPSQSLRPLRIKGSNGQALIGFSVAGGAHLVVKGIDVRIVAMLCTVCTALRRVSRCSSMQPSKIAFFAAEFP